MKKGNDLVIAGIDEAGRGPIIGPLVMCGFAIKENLLSYLEKLKVKDSKLLTEKERNRLYKKITKIATCKIVVINEEEIDNAVNRKDNLNLNWLEANKAAEIINELAPDKIFIDTPSPNIEHYKRYVIKRLNNKNISLVFEHKADLNYPVVSAASIIAKVTRDAEIEKIKQKVGIDFGSGYLSDKKTMEFVKKYYNEYPKIFRKSWATYKDIIDSKQQKRLLDF